MDPKNQSVDVWNQIGQFILRNGYLAWLIFLGLVGQFSYSLLKNKTFTRAYVLGCFGITLFVGYVGGSFIMEHYPAKASLYIPLLTLVSNNIVSAIMSVNYKALIEKRWKAAFNAFIREPDGE